MIQTVNQHWDPLKVCAVGRSYPPEFYERITNIRVRTAMEKIAVETEEDYQKLIKKLESFGVKVLRTDISKNFDDHWPGGEKPLPAPMTPRDHTAAVGGRFFMPSDRYGENIDVETIYNAILSKPLKDVNTPKFRMISSMIEDTLDPNNLSTGGSVLRFRSKDVYKKRRYAFSALDVKEIKHKILQAETLTIGKAGYWPMNKQFYSFKTIEDWLKENNIPIVYDEYINCGVMTRMGKDLYFGYGNIINKINEDRFYDKMSRLFPDHRAHFLHQKGHTDGCFTVVKPGLIITLRNIQNYEKTFPGWEVVTIPGESWHKISDFQKMKDVNVGKWWVEGEENNEDLADYVNSWLDHWTTFAQESVFDTNMLVIDEKNVCVLSENPVVFKAFEKHGITPHVINFRHRYFWDGGLHCMTSDIVREGKQVDYFPERGPQSVVKFWPHY